jgi:lysozyme family protein
MAKRSIKAGTTSQREYVFVNDSASTTGAGKTGIAFNAAGIKAYYVRPGGSATLITLATQTVTGAFSSGGWVEVDSTNMPGVYRFDIPDAVIASGVEKAIVMVSGASGMAPVVMEYDLTAYDPYDTVRLGLTSLPNVASGSAGALITSGTGTAQLSVSSGAVTAGTVSDKTGYSLSTAPPTAAAIADAVWDEASGDHLAAGSTGASLNAAGSAGDPWTTTLPGTYSGSQAGKILADILVDTGTTLQGELDGIQADTEDIQSRLPTALVSGRIDASVGAMAANVLTASALATDAVSEIQSGLATTANVSAVETDTQDIQSRLPAALVSGRIDASVGAMASGVLTAAALATDAVGEIADGVWDEAYSSHTAAGSFGKLLDTLRKANYVTEGSVAAGGTPTTTVFRTNLTEPTGTFDNQTLLFISGDLTGESAPIEAYSVTNGQITLGDALTQAPTAADEFVILPDHVHPIGEIADGVLTRQMTEAYRAAGVAPTLAQALFELIAQMGDSSISGTTKTLKKLDGTTAKTFTLDSSTAPTSITEAT